ncbi:hypothetical protein [Flindersiella endophytica]
MTEERDKYAGVRWKAAWKVVPHWGPLLGPVASVIVPLGLVVSVAYVLVLGDRSVVVNGDLLAVGTSAGQRVWAIVTLLALGLGLLIAQAAGLLVTAGHLLQCPVRVLDALRAAVRRLPVLILAGLLVSVPVAAVAVGALLWWALADGPGRVVITVVVAVGFGGLPYLLLFLPAVVLEGLNPVRALPAVRQTFVGWGFRTRLTLILLLGLSFAVAVGLERALEPVEHRAELGAHTLAGPLAAMLMVPLWNLALAGLYLRSAPHRFLAGSGIGPGADQARVRQVLAEVAGRRHSGGVLRARFLPLVLLALFVPNLAVTGLTWLNPFGTPAVSEHVVNADIDGSVRVDGLGEAGAIQTGADQIAVFNRPHDSDSFTLTGCVDDRCARSASARHEFTKPATSEFPPGFVGLGDGKLATLAWTLDRGAAFQWTEPQWSLRLYRCEGTTCERGSNRVLARAERSDSWVQVARTSDGHIVAAHAGGQDDPPLRLTTCADATCAGHHTVDLGLQVAGFARGGAMALTSDDRPVIAAEDKAGNLVVVTCDTPRCRHPAVTRPPTGRAHQLVEDIEIAIAPDGRPVILYRWFSGVTEYHTRFLRCSSPACDRVTEVDLPEFAGEPVFALDSTGRALITGTRYGLGNPFDEPEYALLLSCRDLDCRHRDLVNLGPMDNGFGAKDMIVGSDDRPRIVWAGARSSGDKVRMHVTTCRQPRCGAG